MTITYHSKVLHTNKRFFPEMEQEKKIFFPEIDIARVATNTIDYKLARKGWGGGRAIGQVTHYGSGLCFGRKCLSYFFLNSLYNHFKMS